MFNNTLEQEFKEIKQQFIMDTVHDFLFDKVKVTRNDRENIPEPILTIIKEKAVREVMCTLINANAIDEVFTQAYNEKHTENTCLTQNKKHAILNMVKLVKEFTQWLKKRGQH